ncbi:AraC family transcriptional regulator [Parabacteroides sp. AM58-2XD]|nr:AraC family transcriptional regulator [Parabacteroides sp. AM58-2XD]
MSFISRLIGIIESQSYFTRIFKNEFGMIPTAFIQKNKAGK